MAGGGGSKSQDVCDGVGLGGGSDNGEKWTEGRAQRKTMTEGRNRGASGVAKKSGKLSESGDRGGVGSPAGWKKEREIAQSGTP